MKKVFIFALLCLNQLAFAQIKISSEGEGAFPVSSKMTICFDSQDDPLVGKIASTLANDVELVIGSKPSVASKVSSSKYVVVAGTIEKSSLIQNLVSAGKIDISDIKGGWERYKITMVDDAFKTGQKAIVVAGTDRRAVAYGLFEISEAIGVSPMYWFADVAVEKQKSLYITSANIVSREPAVKYRGVFINDEGWGITPWARNTFDTKLGDIGPKTYDKVCEFLLRMKANMLAPAMHPSSGAFNKYPENKVVADSWGIIMSSSHCEPLLYNNTTEWDSKVNGEWNYMTNKDGIMKVLDKRVSENYPYENIYTIAMRGIHDAGLVGVPKDKEVSIVEEVIGDQRGILSKYIDTPIEKIPQIFVPYKEVQSIYQRGLKVPDDITLVWPDDNYGYIKQLSNKKEQMRSGGAGVYYHISYLGAPHDYLWLNTTPPALMYEELKKAYDTNGRRYWLLNVGDIKPGELGIHTFLDMAYDMDNYSYERANESQVELLAKLFGAEYKETFADVLTSYYKLGFQHKPEMMGWGYEWNSREHSNERLTDTEFSFTNYNEAQDRIEEYERISDEAQKIYNALPKAKKPSFFELVLYQFKGAMLMNKTMLLAQLNRQYAREGRALTNTLAEKVKLYRDSIDYYSNIYNTQLNGKWNHMMTLAPGWVAHYMDMPHTETITLPEKGELKIEVEGSNASLSMPSTRNTVCLNPYTGRTTGFDIYNTGKSQIKWSVKECAPWIKLSANEGEVVEQQHVAVSIDWTKAPKGNDNIGTVTLDLGGKTTSISVPIFNPETAAPKGLFIEENGYVSIPGGEFSEKIERNGVQILKVEGLGYDGSCVQLGSVVDPIQNANNAKQRSCADYEFYCYDAGAVTVYTYALPTFAVDTEHGTRFGLMIDDGLLKYASNNAKEYSSEWNENVYHNASINSCTLSIDKPGRHTLHVICADPGVLIQKIVIDFGGMKKSFLGPKSTKSVLE